MFHDSRSELYRPEMIDFMTARQSNIDVLDDDEDTLTYMKQDRRATGASNRVLGTLPRQDKSQNSRVP